MKRSRLLGLLLALMFVMGGAALGEPERTFVVGICQSAQHETLKDAAEGFCDALGQALGDRVRFETYQANGDFGTCTMIMNTLVSGEVDLILADATMALQAAASATDSIPILGVAVTDFAAALELDAFDGTVGGNISGVSDRIDAAAAADAIVQLCPDAARIGVLYCSSEPNSRVQIGEMRAELARRGIDCGAFPFIDSGDLSAVTQAAVAWSDVLYIPTDNTVAAHAQLVANVCLPEGVPVVTGDESTCAVCGAASIAVDYTALGQEAGRMAAQVLLGAQEIGEMPVRYAPGLKKSCAADRCAALGIAIPEDYDLMETD